MSVLSYILVNYYRKVKNKKYSLKSSNIMKTIGNQIKKRNSKKICSLFFP